MDDEIQNVISVKSQVVHGNFIQTTANYIRRCQKTSALAQTDKHFKSEEKSNLRRWIVENVLTRDEALYFIDTVFLYKIKISMMAVLRK